MSYYITFDSSGGLTLAHHGILGQKWGVRRYQNKDGSWTIAGRERYGKKIQKMYSRQNAKNEKLAAKYEARGKKAKAAALRAVNKKNEEALQKSIESGRNGLKRSLRDSAFGGQKWMSANYARMNSPISRLEERQIQLGMRFAARFTSEKTLSRMSAEDGANYLRSKYVGHYQYAKGVRKGKSSGYELGLQDAKKAANGQQISTYGRRKHYGYTPHHYGNK